MNFDVQVEQWPILKFAKFIYSDQTLKKYKQKSKDNKKHIDASVKERPQTLYAFFQVLSLKPAGVFIPIFSKNWPLLHLNVKIHC